MTKEEFSIIAKTIKTAYPNQKVLESTESYDLWYKALSDLDYGLIEAFIEKWILTENWSPSIAQIRSGCIGFITDEIAPWEEEWKKVINAIGTCGRDGEDRAMKKFNAVTQKVVRCLGWRSICNEPEENTMSLRANFRDCYNRYAERQMQDNLLPASLRNLIEEFKPRDLFLEDGT